MYWVSLRCSFIGPPCRTFLMMRAFAFLAIAVCMLALSVQQLLQERSPNVRMNDFVRYGRCNYFWFWSGLTEVGDFIVKARVEGMEKEEAWLRWQVMNATRAIIPTYSTGARRGFNGTRARFVELWDMDPCPPGPCGIRGHPCPVQFPGFQCSSVQGDGYCCDSAGCYHDSCDNDGCYPYYEPHPTMLSAVLRRMGVR